VSTRGLLNNQQVSVRLNQGDLYYLSIHEL